MGLGDFFKEVGDVAASGIETAASAVNVVDRYVNPFHVENQGLPESRRNESYDTPLGNALSHQVETASRGMTWLKDNGVSQPISTALMAGMLPGGPFSTHNWAMAWHAANHISPGQALFLNSEETKKAVESPLLYYKPGSAQLPPGFDQLPQAEQQRILKDAGLPAVGNAYIQELRQSSKMFKYTSGITDFSLAWWADPVIIAGRAAGDVRRARQVIRRPQGAGWSAGDIDQIMEKSTMGKAVDFIYANRENPQLLNNLTMARNSALGPRFGAIASLLKTPGEVHDFLRVGLGDVDAIARLQSTSALAAARIEQDTGRVAALDLMATRFDAAGTGRASQYATLARKAMDDANARINADESLVTRYNQVLDHAHELDEVNLSRWSFARAQDRTAAQAAYRARAARGGKAGRQVTIQPTPIFSRGTSSPVDLGFQKSRLYGVGDFFSTPVTMVRAFANARPNGYMRIDDIDKDSIAELRGHIARIPGISDETRLNMLNEYLKTSTEGERLALLNQIGATGAAKMAEKHGLEPEAGLDIYKEHLKRKAGEIDNMKRYSAAYRVRPSEEVPAGIRVDEFGADGAKLVVHPNLVTRLVNDHVFQDLDAMDKVLTRHSSALRAIRTSRGGNPDWLVDAADRLTHLWKFGTLFRLGYIPRVAGDDLAGQVARLGAASMALRIGWGVRNGATNLALWKARPMMAARLATARQGAEYASAKIKELAPEVRDMTADVSARRAVSAADVAVRRARLARAVTVRDNLPADAPAARRAAARRLVDNRTRELEQVQADAGGARAARLAAKQEHLDFLRRQQTSAQALIRDLEPRITKQIQGSRPVALPGGVRAPAALEGKEGDYYRKMISSDDTIGQIFLTNKALIHGHLMRSFDHGGKVIRAADNEALHATSWAHAINAQLMQDQLAVQAVRGASPESMARWLETTAEGRQYQRRIGLTPGATGGGTENRVIANTEDLANAAWHDVAEYMPTPEIRAAALSGELTPKFLKEHIPQAQRPEVHTGQVGQSQGRYQGAVNDVIAGFYKVAASLPADRWSRHPLFNQLYEGHLKTVAAQLKKQGAYDTTVAGVERMATTARRLALKDTRKLVFDIAHRSDAAAALRLISPFMAATTESFQRWGRIIADKPQVVGYAHNFYNAPIASGNMQDADGNDITREGYSYTIDPKTGRAVKRLVPKSERFIVGRMPKALAGKAQQIAFGVEPASRKFRLSQNSMDLVTQGDPWFNPGVGPVVQIPVNEFVKDKPQTAELARHLGVLPFGPQQGTGLVGEGPLGRAAGFLLPNTIKNFLTAYDTSDERYQNVKLQIMQRAAFEHDQLGKPMPSAKKIADMTKQYWLFSAASAFLQPMATQKKDAYQFYRDQYNALRRANPLTADDEFLARYSESYFIFAQSQSHNESGIPATKKAVALQEKYGDLISANPELGALIVGPEGNGPFSPEAYSYQLNHPLTPGGAEAQRTKMSATEAMQENQRRLGWSKYTAKMNQLGAELRNRGLKSYADKGAEDLKAAKAAYTALWSQPTTPDGEANPFYNEAWSRDFSTLDDLKYERLIPGLQAVARSPLADQPNRSDLRVLRSYLGARRAVTQLLQERAAAGGRKTLAAKDNADLAGAWQRFVDGLIESDTRFGDLHSRYLSRDLGYEGQEEA